MMPTRPMDVVGQNSATRDCEAQAIVNSQHIEPSNQRVPFGAIGAIINTSNNFQNMQKKKKKDGDDMFTPFYWLRADSSWNDKNNW